MSLSPALVLLGPTLSQIAVRDHETWNWSEIASGDAGSTGALAEKIVSALRAAGYSGSGVVLGVPASQCFSAAFDSSDLPANDYKARLFRFEEQLPLSAEQIVAEFLDTVHESGARQTFGLALKREWIAQQVSALEAAGVAVDFIVPSTLLALDLSTIPVDRAALVEEPADSHWQLIVCDSQHVRRWLRLPRDCDSLRRTLRTLTLRGDAIDSIQCIDATLPANCDLGVDLVPERQEFKSQVSAGVENLLRGRSNLPNFRRNGLPAADRLRLYRPALNAALVGVAAMLVLISTGLWLRAARYTAISDRNQQAMMTRFHATLPGWPTPSNFRAIVASERRRFSPVGEGRADMTALSTLARVLHCLPASDEVSLSDLSFAAQHFELAGTLKRYESAQSLADAVRSSGWDVSPVQAHRVADNSWQFVLSGQVPATSKASRP